MEKDPMWTDELDERGQVTVRPFPSHLDEKVQGEHGVRVVARNGLTYEGVVDFDRMFNSALDPIVVNDRRFCRSAHAVYLLDPADVVVRDHEPVTLTDGEIRDLIVDVNSRHRAILGKAPSVSIDELVRAAIGFEPHLGLPTREYRGLTKDGYVNQFLRIGALKKSLERLQAEGLIRKAVAGRDSSDWQFVSMSGKVGYLTPDAYDEAVAYKQAEKNTAAIEKLRQEAIQTVAARHQDEVDAELDRLRTEKGLS